MSGLWRGGIGRVVGLFWRSCSMFVVAARIFCVKRSPFPPPLASRCGLVCPFRSFVCRREWTWARPYPITPLHQFLINLKSHINYSLTFNTFPILREPHTTHSKSTLPPKAQHIQNHTMEQEAKRSELWERYLESILDVKLSNHECFNSNNTLTKS